MKKKKQKRFFAYFLFLTHSTHKIIYMGWFWEGLVLSCSMDMVFTKNDLNQKKNLTGRKISPIDLIFGLCMHN